MRQLEVNTYRRILDDLKPQILQHRGDPNRRCSELATAHHVPVAAVLSYAARTDVIGDASLQLAAVRNARWYGLDGVTDWVDPVVIVT